MSELVPTATQAEAPELALGQLIKQARTRRNKRLADIRDLTGISLTTLSNLENGRRRLSPARLARVVDAVGADVDEAFALFGQAPPQASAELVGPDLRRTRQNGFFTSDARHALRRVHLIAFAAEALERFGALRLPIDIEDLLFRTLEVDLQAGTEWRLANAKTIELPPSAEEPSRSPSGRARLAHLGAHVMIAAESGVAPACPERRHQEEDADFLAGALLMPRPALLDQLPYLAQPYDVASAEDVGALIGELAQAFDVPAWMATEQLVHSGGLTWAAGGTRR